MDSGLELEMALRFAVDSKKDFERFADVVRSLRYGNDGINVSIDEAFHRLALAIKKWPELE